MIPRQEEVIDAPGFAPWTLSMAEIEQNRLDYPDIGPGGSTSGRGVKMGDLLFIVECTARGTDPQGKPLLDQLRVTLNRITRTGAAEGTSSGDIVKSPNYVTSIDDWRVSALEQESLFNGYFKSEYPADTLVEITALSESEDRVCRI